MHSHAETLFNQRGDQRAAAHSGGVTLRSQNSSWTVLASAPASDWGIGGPMAFLCVCVEMNFLGCNSYKEGMEEGQNGVS